MSEMNSFQFPDQAGPNRSADSDAIKPANLVGHALFERIGVGGMGEVFRCGDDALGRNLAIKVIKADRCGDEAAERRFFREARVTGSLQHPGIVPIHNLGRLADGRLCYTMKLVRGRTFADILRDEPTGPERLPHLLAIVEKVCQAVAYAHSKGVLHRDLKPSNVMVGKFGEVQVMDWGLAKVLSREDSTVRTAAVEEEACTLLYTTPASMSEDMSRTGAALGTPSYMPPEQAMGERELVDERADVFALGAILCELLTGSPPYRGGPRDELLRRARRGDLAEPLGRLERCGADAALVQLCRECLAAEREGRPRNADVVAKRLAEYQADVQERLRRAERELAAAQARVEEVQILLLFGEGLTNEEAAVRLGWPVGRLLKARQRLHECSTRPGVSLTAGEVVTPMAASSGEAVAPPIATTAAARLALDGTVRASAAVTALADQAIQGAALSKVKIVLVLLLAALAGLAGLVVIFGWVAAVFAAAVLAVLLLLRYSFT
jgi:tRNA A-37 threonylcarbamoyl transferase component Bud32